MMAPLRLLCCACLKSVETAGTSSRDESTPQTCPGCGGMLSDGTETSPHEPGGSNDRLSAGVEDRWRMTWTSGSLGRLGRFQLKDVLGGGGHGDVYRAYDPRLDRDVALKVLKVNNLGARAMERFFREARAAARLEHPSIVAVFDAGHDDGRCWIAYQFIPGRTLSRYRDSQAMDPRSAARVVRDLAEALEHAHGRGMAHRDLKPANVIMDAQGRPHLTDFGLARRLDVDSDLTCDGAILGTPAYMSPEQAAGRSAEADARSDVYSLGVIFYELLCGHRPTELPTNTPFWLAERAAAVAPPRRVDRAIPPELDRICRKALADEPSARYPDARCLMVDLDRWLARRPHHVRPGAAAAAIAAMLVTVTAVALPANFGRGGPGGPAAVRRASAETSTPAGVSDRPITPGPGPRREEEPAPIRPTTATHPAAAPVDGRPIRPADAIPARQASGPPAGSRFMMTRTTHMFHKISCKRFKGPTSDKFEFFAALPADPPGKPLPTCTICQPRRQDPADADGRPTAPAPLP